jgi:Zn finger protein HypA/HybF involved in hydrogenase expression
LDRVSGLHQKIADDVPQLKRGQVWCRRCGNTFNVNGADCLANGWPKCCGQTMSIDSPEGRVVS